ncbi:MAG: ATP-binding protein [Bryobacteraceae bacterium]
MKRLGITAKLAASSTIILLGLGIAVIVYSVSQLHTTLYQETARRVEAQTLNWIEANTSQLTFTGDAKILQPLVDDLQEREGIAYVILLDEQGRERVSAGEPEGLAKNGSVSYLSSAATTIDEMEDGRGELYFELGVPISVSGTGMSKDLETMFGVAARQETLGSIRIGVAHATLLRHLRSILWRNIPLYGLLVLLAVCTQIVFARQLVKPIVRMGNVAEGIAAGNLTERVAYGSQLEDEMGELVRNFNRMADRLAENREEMNLLNQGLEEKVRERTLELEEANRRLQELDRMKSRFISTVSHEFRTPLTSIKAFAEILLDSPGGDPATRKRFLEIIDTESDRLSRLISDLLDLAKIESGSAYWRMADMDLQRIIVETVATFAPTASKKQVSLEVIESEPQPIHADRDRIQQVVTNLLSNAVKFSPSGGLILVSNERCHLSGPLTALPGDYVRVGVRDCGPGIPPEDRHKVFERFYQGANIRPAGTGTGLGLAISREIVLHHKGEIWVESELGQGSTFFFTVPLAVAHSAAAQPVVAG